MFPISLILKTYADVDVSERTEEEKEKISRTMTIKQLEEALFAAFRMGQKSGRTDEEEF